MQLSNCGAVGLLGLLCTLVTAHSAPAAISPPPMSPRAIVKPAAPPPGQQVSIRDADCEATLFVPQSWTCATNGQVPLTIHFHSATWFAIDEHLRHGLKTPLLAFYLGEGSSKYREPFSDPQRLERMLRLTEQQLALSGGTNLLHIASIDISSFSAGYGAVREILKAPEYRKMIRRVVLCDSLYASFEVEAGGKTNRVPAREHIEPWLPFARAAAAGQKTFVLTHSQVPTANYANSAECAQALIAAVGVPIQKIAAGSSPAAQGEFPLLYRSDLGNFHVWGYAGTNAMAHMIHARHLAEVWQALDSAELLPTSQPPAH